jgi:hypothetical protein
VKEMKEVEKSKKTLKGDGDTSSEEEDSEVD